MVTRPGAIQLVGQTCRAGASGLGLSVVRQLVLQAGGTVWADDVAIVPAGAPQ